MKRLVVFKAKSRSSQPYVYRIMPRAKLQFVSVEERLFKNTLLQESLRIRWQAGALTIGPFVILCAVLGLALQDVAPLAHLLTWWLLILSAAAARIVLGCYTAPRLDIASTSRLQWFENLLRLYVAAINLVLASAFWIIDSNASHEILVLLTIASCLYAAGSLAYHSVDLTGYIAGLICNLAQTTAFWLLGAPTTEHFLITGMLLLLALTAGYQAYLTQQRFHQSGDEGLNKKLLVMKLEQQKRSAEKAASTAQKASRAQSMFLGAASHDLRQPVHALSLLTETLVPLLAREDQRFVMSKIQDTVSALESLFTGILDLSRFNENAVRVHHERFDLCKLVERIAKEFAPQVQLKGVGLHLSTISVQVISDSLLLERVLRNLLSNAVRHTSKGEIRLSVEVSGPRARITLSDTGPGIPVEHQRRVFDEYVRIDGPSQPYNVGVGLGLSIVRRIDSLLGLDLQMQSDVGVGTKFQIFLPRVLHPERLLRDAHA